MIERVADGAHGEGHLVLRRRRENPALHAGLELVHSDELSSLVDLGFRFHLVNVTFSISQEREIEAVSEIHVPSKFRNVNTTGFNGLDVSGMTRLMSNSWQQGDKSESQARKCQQHHARYSVELTAHLISPQLSTSVRLTIGLSRGGSSAVGSKTWLAVTVSSDYPLHNADYLPSVIVSRDLDDLPG